MSGFLQNLRKKPEPYKRRVTMLASFLITAVIFIGWLIVVFNTFEIGSIENGQASETQSIREAGPFSALFDNFSAGVKEIRKQLKNINQIF